MHREQSCYSFPFECVEVRSDKFCCLCFLFLFETWLVWVLLQCVFLLAQGYPNSYICKFMLPLLLLSDSVLVLTWFHSHTGKLIFYSIRFCCCMVANFIAMYHAYFNPIVYLHFYACHLSFPFNNSNACRYLKSKTKPKPVMVHGNLIGIMLV